MLTRRRMAFWGIALSLAACGPRADVANGGVEPRTGAPVRRPETVTLAGEPILGEGVVAIPVACDAAATDHCNALDDDCDHLVDEGCPGVTDVQVSVVAAWSGPAQLDVRLVDSAGAELGEHAGDLTAGSQATGEGGCAEPASAIRTAAAGIDHAPAGGLTIELAHVRACDAAATPAPTHATVSVRVGGEVLGPFNGRVAPDSALRVATLRFGPSR